MSNVPHPGVRRELQKISRDVQLVVDRLERAIANQSKLDQTFSGLKKASKKPAKRKPK